MLHTGLGPYRAGGGPVGEMRSLRDSRADREVGFFCPAGLCPICGPYAEQGLPEAQAVTTRLAHVVGRALSVENALAQAPASRPLVVSAPVKGGLQRRDGDTAEELAARPRSSARPIAERRTISLASSASLD